MQEELKEIEILTFIYKTLKEKAEKRVSEHGTTTYRCDDSNLFELYVDILDNEEQGDEELWVGQKRIDNATLKLIQEKSKEPEPFYCQENGFCDKQCTTCQIKEVY